MAGKSKAIEKKQAKKESTQRSDSQTGKEALLIWAILGEGGGKAVSQAVLEKKGMLPGKIKSVRDELERRGLITVEDRTTRNERGRSTKGKWMMITQAGLTWAEENLAAKPAKMQAASPILQAWMARLSVYLQTHQILLTKFLEPRRGSGNTEGRTRLDLPAGTLHEDSPAVTLLPVRVPAPLDYDALRARIRQAYFAVTGNRINTRARLSDIRQKLNDIDPSALDATLKRMQQEQQVTLYPLDNKAEITDADRSAAIYFGSEPRHILWIAR